MSYAYICDTVSRLRKKYKESDIRSLCQTMGILINPVAMGTDPDSIKGFFLRSKRIPVITVNSDLPDLVQRFIIAHELGHAILHKDRKVRYFHEAGLFDQTSPMEKEANFFAAELLMKDEDVLEQINRDCTFFSAAAMLNVPAELLDFKFRLMKWKGYKMVEPPIHATNDFLRDIPLPDQEGES